MGWHAGSPERAWNSGLTLISFRIVVSHEVVLTTALAAVIGLPGVVLLMLRSGDQTMRRAWVDRARADTPAHLRLEHAGIGAIPDDAAMPPVDQVAAQLRRLHRQQHNGTARGSRLWQGALSEAYDRWLDVACRHYDVHHHMSALAGVDRDLERMRVEAALTEHGLQLPPR